MYENIFIHIFMQNVLWNYLLLKRSYLYESLVSLVVKTGNKINRTSFNFCTHRNYIYNAYTYYRYILYYTTHRIKCKSHIPKKNDAAQRQRWCCTFCVSDAHSPILRISPLSRSDLAARCSACSAAMRNKLCQIGFSHADKWRSGAACTV